MKIKIINARYVKELSPTQTEILEILKKEIYQCELEKTLGIKKSLLSKQLEPLKEYGLIRVIRKHGRKKVLKVTAFGKSLKAKRGYNTYLVFEGGWL